MNIESESELKINPGEGKKVIISFEDITKEDRRPFSFTGPIKYKGSYNQHARLDIIDLMHKLTSSGRQTFICIKDYRDKNNNISNMNHWQDFDAAAIRNIQRGLKDLYLWNLVCKAQSFPEYMFKPESYTMMINPYIIKPNNYLIARKFWAKFTGQVTEFE